MPSSPATAPRARRLLTAVVVAAAIGTAATVAPPGVAGQPAPLAIADPGLRGGSAGSLGALQIFVTGGTPPYTFTLNSVPALPAGFAIDPDGLITGTFGSPASYSVTVTVKDSADPVPASVTFEWRVSDWQVADLFVGVSSPDDGIGRYRVMRPGPAGATGLETVEIPTDQDTWFWNTGLAFGCAVDPYSGLLYTTDFDAKVNVIDSLEGATGHEILQRIISARAPGASDPPTEHGNYVDFPVNYISWQPESIVFSADRRFLVGHVGGLLTGYVDDAPLVPPATFEECFGYFATPTGRCPWEVPIAVDGLAESPQKAWPLTLPDAADRWNFQLLAPFGTTTAQQVPDQAWYYVLDQNDPANPIAEDGCLLGPAPTCTVPDPSDQSTWTSGLSVPSGWLAATPRRLSITTLNPTTDYAVAQVGPFGFLETVQTSGEPLPVIEVVGGVPRRVPARRWWGKDVHVFDSKAGQDAGSTAAVEATLEYYDTGYGRIGTDWIDLAADQRRLYYTSETSAIYIYDLGDPGDPANGIPATPPSQRFPFSARVPGAKELFGLRLLPPGDGTGGLLVAGNPSVLYLRPKVEIVTPPGGGPTTQTTLEVVRTYDVAGVNWPGIGVLNDDGYFALSVSPDAKSFWTASNATGYVYHFRIADGALLDVVDMSTQLDMTNRSVNGLCLKREYNAAREPCNGIDDDANGVVDDNCLPLAFPDAETTPEDTSVLIDVVPNDYDPDGDPLTPIIVTQPAHGTAVVEYEALPSGGAYPRIRYTPAPDFDGTDTLTYKVFEGAFESTNTATVTITVTPVSDPPVAEDDAYATAEDTPLTIAAPGVLANDTDPDGDTLVVWAINGTAAAVGQTVTLASGGQVTLNADGSFGYVPPPDFNGTEGFTYTASDGEFTSTATVTLTATPVNDPPVAADDSYTTAEDTPLTIAAPGVLVNDSDVDSPALTVTAINGVTANVGQSVTLASGAQVTLNGDGSFSYVPAPDFDGSDSFGYTVGDGTAIDTATVAITVMPVNDDPVAVDDAYAVAGAPSLHVPAPGVLANDSDVDGDTLSVALLVAPVGGALTLNADGSFDYSPNPGTQIDTFTYTVSDGAGGTDSATVTITVNQVPVCTDAVAVPAEIWPPNHKMVPVAITGVTDPDGDELIFSVDSIFQDEPTDTAGDGSTAIDGAGVGTSLASVRAERTGTKKIPGNGRVYHIAFTATDPVGAACSGEVTVGVPHDQGHGPAIDDGPLYDSTVAFPVPTGDDDDHGKGGKKADEKKKPRGGER